MREVSVEGYLTKHIVQLGGISLKLLPSVAGVPDRLVILPGGIFILLEMKAPGGRLRPIQRVWHDRAKKLGVTVIILSSKEEVDNWITKLTLELSPRIEHEE